MEARSCHIVLFLLSLSFYSGLCRNSITLREDSSYDFSTTQLDSIPIVNPTTPGSGNPYPTVNPTSPQPPDTSTGGQNPTTPDTSPTTPDTSPTNPYSNPPASTTPYSNPPASTNPYSSPTSPNVTPTTPTTTPTGPSGSSGGGGGGSGQWCVASPSAAETTLKVALDYACGYGADCSQIQQGGTCFDPNTLADHASYAFNDYYQKNPAPTSCVFGGVAALTSKDPSHGNCHYSSSKTTSMSPPNPPPTTMTPPSPTTMTPPSPTMMTPSSPGMTMPDPDGGSSSVYGSPPGSSPNIATSTSFSLLLLLSTTLYATLHLQNYI